MTDEKLYPLSEVAELTGLSERALADAARGNRMPHYRLHGRRYMNQAQIQEYLASGLVEPSVPAEQVVNRREMLLQNLELRKQRRTRRSA